ncbi:MAG: cholesterol oxidase substrate-binding domain-containing protein, partial [Myxococcota bacterium]|nr:cholesterol oxidase substrate-binding domain-containing protein [Myxococcota bacterium]
RRDVQRVVHELAARFAAQLEAHRERGSFPINGPIEMRVTGLDQTSEVEARVVQEPSLSALVPRRDRPEWDAAVWVSVLALPRPTREAAGDCARREAMRPETAAFYAEFERWMVSRFSGGDAMVRPEWSKGWAFGAGGPWTNARALRRVVPRLLQRGRPLHRGWNAAVFQLDALDPWRVFTNPFLDALLRRRRIPTRARGRGRAA